MIIFISQVEAIRFSPYNAEAVGKVNGVNISAVAQVRCLFSAAGGEIHPLLFCQKKVEEVRDN